MTGIDSGVICNHDRYPELLLVNTWVYPTAGLRHRSLPRNARSTAPRAFHHDLPEGVSQLPGYHEFVHWLPYVFAGQPIAKQNQGSLRGSDHQFGVPRSKVLPF